jgi:hypothetical protein
MAVFLLVKSLVMVTNDPAHEVTGDNIKSEIERMNGLFSEPLTAAEEAAYESLFDPVRFEPRQSLSDVSGDVLKQYFNRWRNAGLRFPLTTTCGSSRRS